MHPEADLSRYAVVLVPSLYLATDAAAANVAAAVRAGAHAVVSFFNGIVDEHDHARLGGYPGAFADLLGVRVEEFYPLPPGEGVGLDDGTAATTWIEDVGARDAEPVVRYAGGAYAGRPAVTRREVGGGVAWYAGARLDDDSLERLLSWVCREAGVAAVVPGCPRGMAAVRRRDAYGDLLFLLNHTDQPARLEAAGMDLLTGARHDRHVELPAEASPCSARRMGDSGQYSTPSARHRNSMNGLAFAARASHSSRKPLAVACRCVSEDTIAKLLRLMSSISGWSAR